MKFQLLAIQSSHRPKNILSETLTFGTLWPRVAGPRDGVTATRLLRLCAAALLISSPAWLFALFHPTNLYDPSSSYFLVTVLTLAGILACLVVARGNPFLRKAIIAGLFAKVAACGAYLYMSFNVYYGASDSLHYFSQARVYAADVLWNGHWQLWRPVWSANAIYMLAGALVVFLGPALQAVNVIFAFCSFAGQYFFYRAAVVAFPTLDVRAAALLMFLFPSLVFWPACISKDAVIAFGIGLAVYGFALMNVRLTPGGVGKFVCGLLIVTVVRPHVAAMLAIAALLPFLHGGRARGMKKLGRLVAAPLLFAGVLYLMVRAQDFLQLENVSQAATVIHRVGESNNLGGSAFEGRASTLSRVIGAPLLFFRPFPWEVRSVTSFIATTEGMLLVWLLWRFRSPLGATLRGWRRNPFVAFLLLFTLEFCLVYSAAITNFGLLTRQRVMALPMLLILLSVRADNSSRASAPKPAQSRDALSFVAPSMSFEEQR